MDNTDINEVVVSNKVSFGEKDFECFIDGNAKKIKPSCILLPKMNAYRRDLDKTKCVSSLIKYEKLLEKYNETWKKVSNIIITEFDGKRVYNKKYLQPKIKSYNGNIYTNFHNNKIPKEGSQCILLSVI